MPNGVAARGASKAKADKAKADKGRAERKADNFFSRLFRFIRESYIEVVKKAAWPNWSELKKFTAVVILAVVIVGIWIGGLDATLSKLTRLIGFGPK